MKTKSNKKGFTLIELLATIVIIGILSIIAITAVDHYIQSAHKEQEEQNIKTVSVAAELYLQANRSLFPKQIGDETKISLTQLREANYLKEDIKNSKGESCMPNSYVRVFKMGQEDYIYTPYIYCGSDTEPTTPTIKKPSVENFKFIGQLEGGTFNDVKDAKFEFDIWGDEDHSGVKIYSYQYAIFVRNVDGGTYREVYNSGSILDNSETSHIGPERVSKYVDFTGYSQIRVDVTVFNEEGGRFDYTTETDPGITDPGKFQDQTNPICGNDVTGQAANANDWINKSDNPASRRITVPCQDNPNGSGCKRKKFSQTWPYDATSQSNEVDYKYGARWSYITISDNAKTPNTTDCYVRVNVDLQAPTVKFKVYSTDTSGNRKHEVYSTTVVDNDLYQPDISHTVYFNDYSSLHNGEWMNDADFPHGIIIDIDVEDNLYLDEYSWSVNEPDTDSETVGALTGEQKSGFVPPDHTLTDSVGRYEDLLREEKGRTSYQIHGLTLSQEGKRYAEFKMCDKAKNCTTVKFQAHIDVTHPSCNNKIDYGTGSSASNYNYVNDDGSGLLSGAGWLSLVDGRSSHNLEMARITEACTDPHNVKSDCSSSSISSYIYATDINTDQAGADGPGVVSEVSDNAGNTTTCPFHTVKIDYQLPTCEVTSNPAQDWTNQSVTVSRACKDDTSSPSNYNSGCTSNSLQSLSYTYDGIDGDNWETTQATANGLNAVVEVEDEAGNIRTCDPKTVKIDKKPPECKVTRSPDTSEWTRDSVVVSNTCNETVGSLCASGQDHSYTYSGFINTNQASSEGNGGTVTVRDNAGNVTTCENKTVKVDQVAPTGTCRVNGYYTDDSRNELNIVLTSSSDQGIGVVDDVRYLLVGVDTSYTYNSQYSLSCGGIDVFYYAKMKLTDSLGNESSAITCDDFVWVPGCCNIAYIDVDDDPITPTCRTALFSSCALTELGGLFGFHDYLAYSTLTSPRMLCYSVPVSDCSVPLCSTPEPSSGATAAPTSTSVASTPTPAPSSAATPKPSARTNICGFKGRDEDLFGNDKGSISGNSGSFYSNLGGQYWGDWCHADGKYCNPSTGYDRICATSNCGTYYGKTAKEINSAAGCNYAKYWCSCSGRYGGTLY